MRHSSFLEVDLGLMAQNFKEIQKLAPRSSILPMVKADAYGNGLIPVSQFLENECGVKKLGCATLGEALQLVEECPDLKSEILVFSDTEIQNAKLRDAYLNHNITPVLFRSSDLDLVLSDPDLKKIPLVLKLNTGMNRLGLAMADLEKYLPRLKSRGVEHLLTHFARASDTLRPEDKTQRQFEEFKKMKKFLIDGGVEIRETSVANSGAIEQGFGIEETYVRPGLMLYGPPSVQNPTIWNGHQVSRLVTKIISTFPVKKGVPIGYGVNVADRDGFVAILALGYGDGFIALDSGTKLSVKGHSGKIFGRVSMDMAHVFFGPDVAGKIKEEDEVEIWSHDSQVITDIANQNKTIPYKLMCGISSRIPRIYKVK